MFESVKRYINESKTYYSIAAFFIILNLGFQFIIIDSKENRAEELREEFFSLRKEKLRAGQELKEIQGKISRMEEMSKDLKTFIAELPDRGDMTRIIQELHKLASKSGLKISASKHAQSYEKDYGLIKYTISFPISGSYRQIRKFIYDLEKLPYLMSIDDITISSNKKRKVSLPVTMSIYFRAEEP